MKDSSESAASGGRSEPAAHSCDACADTVALTANSAAIPAPASPEDSCRPTRAWMKSQGAGPGPRTRAGIVLMVLVLLFGGLSLRLVQIQVGQGTAWKKKADDEKVSHELMNAPRGGISFRDGLPLAFCLPCDTVIADLKILQDRRAAALALAPYLNVPPLSLFQKMDRPDRRIVYLSRFVEPEVAERIRALKIHGIGFEDEFRRTYPQGSLACHLVGWSGMDGGMEGIEKELDGILKGTPGCEHFYHDAARQRIAINDGATGPGDARPPHDGLAVALTLDARIQQTAEEQLREIQRDFQPKSATCVVMDVRTGAVLAMACTPDYDPNNANKYPAEDRRNRVVTDIYEPGSTFKTFAAAMSMELKLWRRNETINCENGAWNLGYRTLHDAHAYGILTFDDVIAKSSNIGAAKIACRMGLERLYATVRAFGFGEPTGINFPGEVKGRVRMRSHWTNDSLYSVGMGHEVGVTPIQLAAAYCAVVNGGILYRPKVVQRIVNENGEELYTLHPQVVRRVISEETSAQMRQVLARVVQPGGTGAKAFCAEWPIGGKTGTTKKIDPQTHQYSSTLYIGSFCGFAPVDQPRLVCLVTVDEPRKGTGYYGGTVACPAVREILRKGMTVLNVPSRTADEQKKAIAHN